MKLIAGQRMLCKLTNLGPSMDKLPLANIRRLYDLFDSLFGIPRDKSVQTRDISVPNGSHTIPIRIYRPQGVASLSMVYFHGGGYVIGSLASHDNFCRKLASQTKMNIIAVDYRLAPENKYPTALDDSLVAWNWIVDNADNLQLGSGEIGVGGDSAGGNIAAVLAMQLFSTSLPNRALSAIPAFQFLLYPLVDFRCQSESFQRYGKGLLLTEPLAHFFHECYLGGINQFEIESIGLAFMDNIGKAPDTIIVTAEYDVLRDEGLDLVEKLQQAQVPVSHLHLDDCTHGFIALAKFSRATRYRLAEIFDMLAKYAASRVRR